MPKARCAPESFQEYILIDQYSFSVEQFIKEGEREWKFKEYLGKNQILKLGKIDFEIPFSDIYEGVIFAEDIYNFKKLVGNAHPTNNLWAKL